jgi:hypothetical protein
MQGTRRQLISPPVNTAPEPYEPHRRTVSEAPDSALGKPALEQAATAPSAGLFDAERIPGKLGAGAEGATSCVYFRTSIDNKGQR